MQTINTKFLSPTNTKGARIKATASSNGVSVTLPMNYEFDGIDIHKPSVIALAKKMAWTGEMVGGAFDGTGDAYVFVFTNDSKVTL
jgi:hypothetical protein